MSFKDWREERKFKKNLEKVLKDVSRTWDEKKVSNNDVLRCISDRTSYITKLNEFEVESLREYRSEPYEGVEYIDYNLVITKGDERVKCYWDERIALRVFKHIHERARLEASVLNDLEEMRAGLA